MRRLRLQRFKMRPIDDHRGKRAPDAPRTFRTPVAPIVGTIAILGCIYLFFSLPTKTQIFFLGWNAIGLVVNGAVIVAASRLSQGLRGQSRVSRWPNVLLGTVFAGLAAKLAFDARS